MEEITHLEKKFTFRRIFEKVEGVNFESSCSLYFNRRESFYKCFVGNLYKNKSLTLFSILPTLYNKVSHQ